MKRIKVSCNSHLPSKHKSGYVALKVKKSHPSTMVFNPKGKLHMAEKLHMVEICFLIESYKQIAIASCNQ